MKLLKFRIQSYKSINDSEWCWLASDLTTLAGKNESGKSAILEALRDFDTDIEEIPGEAVPLDESREPVIEMCFEVKKATIDEITQETKITISKEVRDYVAKNGLIILKYNDGSYNLEDKVNELLDKEKNESNKQHIKKVQEIIEKFSKIEQLSGVAKLEFDGNIDAIQQAINHYAEQIKAQIPNIPEEDKKQEVNTKLAELATENGSLEKESQSDKFLDKIAIPNFVFFNDFSDILPFEIPFAEAKNHETVKDFASVANIDLDKVVNAKDTQRRKNLLKDHSAVLSDDFMGYWEQDEIKLIADANGENLIIGVEEAGNAQVFKVEQRSKGLQWFLSFYLRLRARESDTNIILIDEPGLYLHAKAQKDVMKVLEKISQKSQVIFSTHSPYLIDAQRLDRVRLILKDDKTGTE